MSALGESSTTAAPSSVPPTVTASSTSVGAPVTGSVPSAGASSSSSGADPVVALNHLADAAQNQSAESQSIFDKAKDIAVPYLNKAQETTTPYLEKIKATTQPYVDKAVANLEHLADKIEGKIDETAANTNVNTGSSTTLGDKSVLPNTGSTNTLGGSSSSSTLANPERRASIVDQIGDKVEGVFASVSNSFSKLTTTIDDKTKSGTQPGLVTQLSQAVERVGEKVDSYLDGTPAQHPSAAAHPVQTTTNSVPHPSISSDPSTSTSSASKATSSTGLQSAGQSSSGSSSSAFSSTAQSSAGPSSSGPSSASTASKVPVTSGSTSNSNTGGSSSNTGGRGDPSEFSGGAGVAEVSNTSSGANADPEIDSRF